MYLHSIRERWYDFRYGVKNLFKWFKVIWADRNWDHVFIYKIIEHKLKLQSESMRNSIILNRDVYADQMKEAAELAARLANTWEYYDWPAIEKFDAVWGATKFDFEPVEGSNGQYFTMVIKWADGTEFTETEKKEYRAARDIMNEEVRKKINLDRRKFYTLIARNIDHWWW
jgi:hypothetical protein